MSKVTVPDFIVIDDDPINNTICKKIIELSIPDVVVHTFTSPEEGIEYIRSAYPDIADTQAILFLDINMPTLTGWDVLDIMTNFADPVKNKVKVYILSSSVDSLDIEKAGSNPLVKGYITKSLSKAKLQAIYFEDKKDNDQW